MEQDCSVLSKIPHLQGVSFPTNPNTIEENVLHNTDFYGNEKSRFWEDSDEGTRIRGDHFMVSDL